MHTRPDTLIDRLARGEDPRTLAESLLWRGLDSDTERSCASCHTPGVDSVVLYDQPDGMVRFYLAHAGSNTLHELVGPDGHFTVGIHNHRYRIAKIALNEPIINVTTRGTSKLGGIEMWEYGFRSALKGEGMEVERLGRMWMTVPQPTLILPGECVVMEPRDLHTVVVPRTRDTAWLVIEGSPQPVAPLLYSPRPDLEVSPEGLYEPMDAATKRRSIQYVLDLMSAR